MNVPFTEHALTQNCQNSHCFHFISRCTFFLNYELANIVLRKGLMADPSNGIIFYRN